MFSKLGSRGGLGSSGSLGGVSGTLYTGQIATNSRMAWGLDTSDFQLQGRTRHILRDNVTSIQIIYWNGYLDINGVEVTAGLGTASLDLGIETAGGTITRVKFSGANTGTVTSGSLLVSDVLPWIGSAGDVFYLRPWWRNATGIITSGSNVAALSDMSHGEALVFGATVPDQSQSGTITGLGFDFNLYPVAIIAQTRKSSIIGLGDSRLRGYGDLFSDATGDAGNVFRSLGPSFAYANHGRDNASLAGMLDAFVGNAVRLSLIQYFSHVVLQLGGADLRAGQTAAVLLTYLSATIAKLKAAKSSAQIFLTTSEPYPVAEAAQNAQAVIYDDAIRAGISGATGYFEIDDVVSTAHNSRVWKPGYSDDNIHANNTGTVAIRTSNAVSPLVIRR